MIALSRSLKFQFTHSILLVSGGLTGLALAVLFDVSSWTPVSQLEKAHDLGIISVTTLNNYPKQRDIAIYMLTLLLPIFGAISFWLPWGFKRRNIFTRFLPCNMTERFSFMLHPLRPMILMLLASALFFLFFDNGYIYAPKWNNAAGAWPLLGEEGQFLEWVQRVLQGEVYGRDFYCQYGPLMLYPLVLWQKISGVTVSASRWYTLCLNVSAYILIAYLIHRIIRSSPVAFVALLFVILIHPYTIFLPHESPLRFFLGLAPLIPLTLFTSANSHRYLIFSGAAAAISFLFSQEVGVCACIASFSYIIVSDVYIDKKKPVKSLLYFILGGCIVVMPIILYLISQGIFVSVVENLYRLPKLIALGYGAMPFPPLKSLFDLHPDPLAFDNYWILFVYSVTMSIVLVRAVTGRLDTKTVILIYLAVFGIVLFRTALGRSSFERAFQVSVPAFLLLFIAIDHHVGQLLRDRKRIVSYASLAMLLVLIFVTTTHNTIIGDRLFNPWPGYLSPKNATTSVIPGSRIENLTRCDVRLTDDTLYDMRTIDTFFRTHPMPEKYVYFFPNEAAYYYLFDKKNPTRYPMSYYAITTEMRRNAVSDLELYKPVYVVYSTATWRIDMIPEQIQVPEIYAYIMSNYDVMFDYGRVVIMRRKLVG